MNFIPLSIPNFEGNEKKYVNEALDQGWVSTGGAYITKLEQEMAKFLNAENIAACQSGTSAIHLSLIEAGIMPGDVVLVPPLTFIAAVNPVRYQQAIPVFIDCDDSFCMDPIKSLGYSKKGSLKLQEIRKKIRYSAEVLLQPTLISRTIRDMVDSFTF